MSNYTQLGFVKQTDGENTGTWGDVLNENLIDLLDDAIGGYVEVSVASGNVTLAFADGTADNNGRHATIKFTGSPGTTRTVTFPDAQVNYFIINGSDSSVICTSGSGVATVTIPTGMKDIIYIDGSDEILSMLATPNISGNVTIGVDDTGYDVKFFGATSGAYMLWDESADDLVLAGAAGIDLAGDIDVDGTANLDNTDIDGTFAVDGTTISLDATTSLNIDNSNTTNGITLGTATSGVPISIGHTTSETTINDNATVTGNLSVGGTFDVTGTIDFSDSAITNAGDIQLDSITGDGDTNTSITFSGSDVITIATGGAGRLTIGDGALSPVTNNQIDLGTASLEFKDAFFDGTVTADAFAGPLTGNVTGNASGTAATVTTAAQSNITSLGTLTALTIDDVAIDGKVVTMTGSSSDTAVFTAGTNGTLSIVTTDAAAAAANIQITADGTVDIDSAGVLTLDSGAAINIEPAVGSAILLDGTISIDAGVVTGATSITSTAFVGDITGDVTGNTSGTAATVTTAAQSNITSLGTLTTLTVDNVIINGTTIGHTSDNDLMTLGSAILTVAGEVQMTTLDIGGTNVTSTAAELNYSDLATLGTTAASKVFSADANNLTAISGAVVLTEDTLTFDATQDWDVRASPVAKVTLTANVTFDAPTNPTTGQYIAIVCIQDGTGSRTIAWNAIFEFTGDAAPTATTTAAKGDMFTFRYNGSKWLEVGRNLNLTLS
jgi:hypothetical protein